MSTPLTGTTLTNQRANNRWKKYNLAVSVPNVVFTARINQTTFPQTVSSINWDGGTGTYGNVKPGMLCRVGSAAGLSDIAILRVRSALTASAFYCGEVDNTLLADNQYLTFVDDFRLWAKRPLKTDESEWKDTSVAFNSTTSFIGIIRLGPPAYVLLRTGATVAMTMPAPGWYSPVGATVISYLWTASAGVTVTNETTSTPTFTIATNGEFVIYCEITDSQSVVTTASRRIFVNPASPVVSASSEIAGDVDSCGFSMQVEGYDGVDTSELIDGALCVLYKSDYAGTAAATQYGPYVNAENVRFVGWLNGQSLSIDPVTGSASFTIDGPAAWLEKINGAPATFTDGAATTWSLLATMNTDKALWSLIAWHSTLASICDITLTGNTTRIAAANINSGSLLEQINGLATEKLEARLCFDALGCGYITIPASLRSSAGKSANTVLFDIAPADLIEQVDIERVTVEKCAVMDVGGNVYDGTLDVQMYGRAISGDFGSMEAPTTSLAIASQTEVNQLSGDYMAQANTEYPSVQVKLYWANDYASYAMAQGWLVRLSMAAGDTPRGIAWTNKRFVIESVSYEFDAETGAESTTMELSEETTGAAGISYYPPVGDDVIDYPPPGDFGGVTVSPPITWFPPVTPPAIPDDGGGCPSDSPSNNFPVVFDKNTLVGTDSAELRSSYVYFPCKLRPAAYSSGATVIAVEVSLFGDMQNYGRLSYLGCYAVDASKSRVLTGSITEQYDGTTSREIIYLTFAPVSATDVAGFELVLSAGGGSDYTYTSAGFISLDYRSCYQFSFYGHTDSLIDTQQSLDLPNGSVEYYTEGTGTGAAAFDPLLWRCETKITLPASSTGSMWMSIAYTQTGGLESQHLLYPSPIFKTSPGNLIGLYKVADYAIGGSDQQIWLVNAYGWANGGLGGPVSMISSVRYMYAASMPVSTDTRKIVILGARISNVCAAG